VLFGVSGAEHNTLPAALAQSRPLRCAGPQGPSHQMCLGSGFPNLILDMTSRIGLGEYLACASCCPKSPNNFTNLRETHADLKALRDHACLVNKPIARDLRPLGMRR